MFLFEILMFVSKEKYDDSTSMDSFKIVSLHTFGFFYTIDCSYLHNCAVVTVANISLCGLYILTTASISQVSI